MARGSLEWSILQGDPVNYLTGSGGWRFSAQEWPILSSITSPADRTRLRTGRSNDHQRKFSLNPKMRLVEAGKGTENPRKFP
jgi:hypothetical protein